MEYKSKLNFKDTERAIRKLKTFFQQTLSIKLNLLRVSAPLFVKQETGLNDNLSGKEKAVSFVVPAIDNCTCEIVHSLAKWKRMALSKYGFVKGEGLYTDMNAIRKDEPVLDDIHSIYVDQWDWEKIISKDERTQEYLEAIVKDIYSVIYKAARYISDDYSVLENYFVKDIKFLKSQDLEDEYPNLTPKERENVAAKKYGAIFIQNIGNTLKSGNKHDDRAPDYDDWQLNGDILVWYEPLNKAVELSSMGIRVDKKSLKEQLALKCVKNMTEYHKAILNDEYVLTVGGGIGQSRLCALMLNKIHIGEVQSSIWPESTVKEFKENGVILL